MYNVLYIVYKIRSLLSSVFRQQYIVYYTLYINYPFLCMQATITWAVANKYLRVKALHSVDQQVFFFEKKYSFTLFSTKIRPKLPTSTSV